MEQATSARGSAGSDFQESDAAAKLELTDSTTANISRAEPALGTLIVCIIQVVASAEIRRFIRRILAI
jgi:hypothetical protein